jgi:Spy/CpxP family protein refolding chaperone
MGNLSRYFVIAVVAFAAALAAVWVSQSMVQGHRHPNGELHQLMHEELDLDAAQESRIEQLEKGFVDRRKDLDRQLREANARLATAMASEHRYGPKVADAVDQSHHAMGELQKATLSHVFAMRAVLRPDQAARFDAAVGKALTRPSDE